MNSYDQNESISGINYLYPTVKSIREITAGEHDYLDQPLCIAAKKVGIDTIILQREIGNRRVITEIIDMRDRSFEYLFDFTPNNKKLLL